jgi:hypothetical protein
MTATSGLSTPRLASPDLLRSVFRRHAAGVAVITARGETGPVGFTATSVASVSADPPMLSFGIGTGASSWPAIAATEYVGVHVLGEHQQELATTFARSGADRFGAPPAGGRTRKASPSSTVSWPGSCAGSPRACPWGTTGSSWPRSSSVTPPAPDARSCTTKGASTGCATESRGSSSGRTAHLACGSVEFRLRCVAKVTVQSACSGGITCGSVDVRTGE